MLRTEMHSPGSPADNVEVHRGGAKPTALKSHTSREILRAKDALQDDSSRARDINLAQGECSNAWSGHD